jgi:integrase
MATGLITKKTVDACSPGPRQNLIWDTKISGFGLLILPSGTKSYIFQYRIGGRGGRTRRYTIGRHGAWTPDQARIRAKELAGMVDRGIDPIDTEREDLAAKREAKASAERKAERLRELAFSDYVDRFLEIGLQAGTRDRTREGYKSTFSNHVTPVLGKLALPEIGRGDIVRTLDRIPISQPSVRRIAFAVMRMLFKWAVARGDISSNPLEGMPAPPAAASRDRVLTDPELALALRAATSLEWPFGSFFRMIFATGQRREEVAGMAWNEIDGPTSTWKLPGARSKNGEANVVPLNRHAMAVLLERAPQDKQGEVKWPRAGLIFSTTGETAISGYSRGKSRLDAKMLELARADALKAGDDPDSVRLSPWRLHDARRTIATAMQRLGVRFEVVEGILNHTAGASRSGVAAVYQRHGWGPEKRAAMDAWADHCDRQSTLSDQTNVIPLRSSPG